VTRVDFPKRGENKRKETWQFKFCPNNDEGPGQMKKEMGRWVTVKKGKKGGRREIWDGGGGAHLKNGKERKGMVPGKIA